MKINPLTKEEMESWPSEPLVHLAKPFIDDRGSIQPLVDLMMQCSNNYSKQLSKSKSLS